MDPALLTPSLDSSRVRPVFSRTALFAAAFLGGGLAITLMAMANSRRLARLPRDGVWLALGLAVSFAAIYLPVVNEVEQSTLNLAARGGGLLIWLGVSYLHREAHRAMETFAMTPPSPYLPVILAICVATLVRVVLKNTLA